MIEFHPQIRGAHIAAVSASGQWLFMRDLSCTIDTALLANSDRALRRQPS